MVIRDKYKGGVTNQTKAVLKHLKGKFRAGCMVAWPMLYCSTVLALADGSFNSDEYDEIKKAQRLSGGAGLIRMFMSLPLQQASSAISRGISTLVDMKSTLLLSGNGVIPPYIEDSAKGALKRKQLMDFTERIQQAATRGNNPFVTAERKIVPGLDTNPDLATVITIDASELKATFAKKIRGKPIATLRKMFYPQFKGCPPKGATGSSRYWSIASNFTKFIKTNEFFKRLQIKLDDEAKILLKGLLEMFEDEVF